MLDEVPGRGSRMSAGAVATIHLLMLTGCRRNEILTLRGEHVDLDAAEIHLADGKTGARTFHLSRSVARVLAALPRTPGNPWVIPGIKPGRHMTDIDAAWENSHPPAMTEASKEASTGTHRPDRAPGRAKSCAPPRAETRLGRYRAKEACRPRFCT